MLWLVSFLIPCCQTGVLDLRCVKMMSLGEMESVIIVTCWWKPGFRRSKKYRVPPPSCLFTLIGQRGEQRIPSLELSITVSEACAPASTSWSLTSQEAAATPNRAGGQVWAPGLKKAPAKPSGNPWARGSWSTVFLRSLSCISLTLGF